jgi:hypothetical protein
VASLVVEGVVGGKRLNVFHHRQQRIGSNKPNQIEHPLALELRAALLEQGLGRVRLINGITLKIQNVVHNTLLPNPSSETSTVGAPEQSGKGAVALEKLNSL